MTDIQQLRDYLIVYNRITEKCFNVCTNNMSIKTLAADEAHCISSCAGKFISASKKFMLVYQSLQPELLRRRNEEVEHQMKLLAEKQKELDAQNTKTIETQ